jgi:hypothetical protein
MDQVLQMMIAHNRLAGNNPGALDVDNMSYEQLLAFEERQGAVKAKGADAVKISQLPVAHFEGSSSDSKSEAKPKNDNANKECSICLMEFQTGDQIKTLPCFHSFHADEVDKWLASNNSCPVCKTKI